MLLRRVRPSTVASLTGLVALTIACSEVPPTGPVSASAASVVAAHGHPIRPVIETGAPIRIHASVAVTGPLDPLPEGCLAGFATVIEGSAEHLGPFTGRGSTCITGQVAPDPDPPFTPAGPGPYATASFTNPRWTLTASSGDELWLEAEGVAVISVVDNSLRAVGTQHIVGGTGRFEGAAGTLSAGAVNDGEGPDDFASDGEIVLPAPRHHSGAAYQG